MRATFAKHRELRAVYVDAVPYVLRGVQKGSVREVSIPKPVYLMHDIAVLNDEDHAGYEEAEDCGALTLAYFVRSLLTCLTLPERAHRRVFREFMRQSIQPTFADRLGLVYGGDDWIEIGDRFWLTPGLDLILHLLDGAARVSDTSEMNLTDSLWSSKACLPRIASTFAAFCSLL